LLKRTGFAGFLVSTGRSLSIPPENQHPRVGLLHPRQETAEASVSQVQHNHINVRLIYLECFKTKQCCIKIYRNT